MLKTNDGTKGKVLEGLSSSEFSSEFFDLYMQSPKKFLTNSLWDFVDDTLHDFSLSVAQVGMILNRRGRPTKQDGISGELLRFLPSNAQG